MTIFLYILAVFILLQLLCDAFYTELPKKVPNMSFVYFGMSAMAHFLAGIYMVISLAIFVAAVHGADTSRGLAAISGLTILLLCITLWRSYKGTKVLDAILSDGSKTSFGAFISGALLPFKTSRPGVKRIADIAYGDAGVKNTLDIYVPEITPETPMPVIIHIHGGAWVVGRKKQQAQPLIQHLVSKGWVAVDINYRLGPKNRFDVLYSDVMRAIAWVKTHISEYGGDPEFVVSTGGSAGGHLTALSALMPNNKDFKAGFENVDCSVKAAVPVYGVYDFLDRTGEMSLGQIELEAFLTKNTMPGPVATHREFWDRVTPMGNIHANAPPMFVLHGRHDALAVFKGAEIFVNALRKVSKNDVYFAALPSGQHAYDCANSPPTRAHVRAVERFLNKVRAEGS